MIISFNSLQKYRGIDNVRFNRFVKLFVITFHIVDLSNDTNAAKQ